MISVDAAELDGIFFIWLELFSYLIHLIKLQEKHIVCCSPSTCLGHPHVHVCACQSPLPASWQRVHKQQTVMNRYPSKLTIAKNAWIVIHRETKQSRRSTKRDILRLAALCAYFFTQHCPENDDGSDISSFAQGRFSARYTRGCWGCPGSRFALVYMPCTATIYNSEMF